MRVIKVYCDHCGKELDEICDYLETELDLLEWQRADLCKDCFQKLQNIVNEFIGKKGKE